MSVAAILLALGAVAYYTSEQIGYFQLKPDTTPLDLEAIRQQKSGNAENSADAEASQLQSAQPSPQPVTPIPCCTVAEKIESYIVTASEFKIDPPKFTVTKNRIVNLIIKADKTYSGPNGLEFASPIFEPVTIRRGEEKVIEFRAETSFTIDVYKKGFPDKLYAVPVTVK
jgi:hypothetical protein